MATLERALEIAAKAHAGQVDKGGAPYILHPIRVMLSVSSIPAQITAILHDVVEDTDITIDDLQREGFAESIIEAIKALTKRKGEDRISAAHRAAQNQIACAVKLADIADNMDLSRIPRPTEKDYDRIREYEQVRAILLASQAKD
jgi:Guanosine polyphosphate pyrophosphohydrolases/synthetases